MPIRLACSTICFRKSPIETALEEIRNAGFEAIDLAVIPGFCPHFDAVKQSEEERRGFVELIRSSGFQVPTLTAVPGNFNEPGADFDSIVATGIANLRLAQELGISILNVNCGKPIEDRSEYREHALLQAKGLTYIAQNAADRGIVVSVEAPHRNGLARTLDEAQFLIDSIGEDNVQFLLDTTHILAGGERPDAAVRRFAGRIAHVHLRDGKGENIFYAPGEGDIDFQRFFEELSRAGYDGWCAFELEGVAETMEERRDVLKRSIDYITKQAGQVAGLRE